MAIKKFGPPLAFAVALTAALGVWPVGCAHTRGPMGPGAESAENAKSKHVPVSFLPAPAFAYAATKNGPPTVSIADVAAEALPSVVNVASTKVEHLNPQRNPFLSDPFFQHFFGGGNIPRERREHALGSGVIIDKNGTILTNNHVVAGASEIKVTTHDRREFKAKVLGTDPKSDVAVIKLEGDNIKGLKPIQMGDSSRLRLGDVVLAIGNPFGIGQTVTMGIVSAKGRANVGIADYEDFIQTDAAINPGNSGGAAGRHGRKAHRHQHGHPVAQRRLPGHRLRHPHEHGQADHGEPDQDRKGRARLARGVDPEHRPESGGCVEVAVYRGRAHLGCRSGQPGRQGRPQARRRGAQARWQQGQLDRRTAQSGSGGRCAQEGPSGPHA